MSIIFILVWKKEINPRLLCRPRTLNL